MRDLQGMQRTAQLLHAKCDAELAALRPTTGAGGAAADASSQLEGLEDTVALRRAVNASLANQMAFFTACVQAWAGPPHAAAPAR